MTKMLVPLLLLSLLNTSCQSSTKTEKKVQEDSWKTRMYALSGSLESLLPHIYTKTDRNDFARDLKTFSTAVQQAKSQPLSKYPAKDPSLYVTMERLIEDVKMANESFSVGNDELAKRHLKNVTQHCFFCHTRSKQGLKVNLAWENKSLRGVQPFEKSDYFVATRQFDRARTALNQVLRNGGGERSFLREKALNKLLLIELRANEDPKMALEAINQYEKNQKVPPYMKKLVNAWKTDLKTWDKSKDSLKNLRAVQSLVTRAEMKKMFTYDEIANVLYLRASKRLHELLSEKQSRKERAQTYFLLGQSYEALRGAGPWNLNEIYYESCIRKWSHSSLALNCYKKLETSMIIGYTGSAGIFIPYRVRKQLLELKELAQPL